MASIAAMRRRLGLRARLSFLPCTRHVPWHAVAERGTAFKRTPVAFASSARHYRRHGSAAVSPPPFSQNEKTDFLGVHIYHADGSRETVDYRKSEVMRMCSLQARDLIALEYSGYHRLPRPILLVRDSSIVVAIGCIRAIIQHNRIMLLHQNLSDSNRATQRVVEILRAIQKNAQRVAARDDDDLVIASEMVQGGSDEQPFECIALEAILDSMCRDHRNRESLLAPLVDSLLQQLSSRRVDPEVLQRLLPMKDSLSQFEIETTMFRDALSELMNNDEDMLEICSQKSGGSPRERSHLTKSMLRSSCFLRHTALRWPKSPKRLTTFARKWTRRSRSLNSSSMHTAIIC